MLLPYLRQLWVNDVLWISIFVMILAQFLKPVTYWLRGEPFDWHHISATGGMPSSHSALVSSVATGVGLEQGFDSAAFAVAVVVAMVVTYDAAGVRQQAGAQARAINQIIAELLSGHPLERIQFREVLGHSRAEVAVGIFFGIGSMLLWKFIVQ
jgi:acid phosphatase family membrane protein YuiD